MDWRPRDLMPTYDAIVVGSGPNGLSAAIVAAQAGLSVLVREASPTVGGSARTAELTLSGFLHDIGSAVHPMAASSPFFRTLPLAEHGLEWIQPPVAFAHPLEGQPAALLDRSVAATGESLGEDAAAYARLIEPLVNRWDELIREILSPVTRFPAHPFQMGRFGMHALLPATMLNRITFDGERARALFAGAASHSVIPLEKTAASAIGLVMAASGHAVGWPIARGGSQQIANALASYLRSLGGVIETAAPVESFEELPSARAVLFDVSPRQLAKIGGRRLPASYRRQLERFAYGPGVFKMDWALSEPIPWTDPECNRTATLHIGGSAAEIAASERDAWSGRICARPFVLLAQQSLYDPSRAPSGKHTAWAYCHVPNGSTHEMTAAIEDQIERFAPGFRDVVLARSTMNTAQLEQWNANLIGGDIGGGANNAAQLLFRPTISLDPYRTPAKGIYICSSSTPPGGGVHGMCGFHAARSALQHTFGMAGDKLGAGVEG
jgi:phytoene dehydrogenase-like protein